MKTISEAITNFLMLVQVFSTINRIKMRFGDNNDYDNWQPNQA